jgi:transposase-like protein
VTVYRWVQTFTWEFLDAARASRHATGDRWFVDETYVKVAGRWTYLYRAVDQHGQIIEVLVSEHRDGAAARAFFCRALRSAPGPVEVTTDGAPVYPRVVEELAPAARHVTEQYPTDENVNGVASRVLLCAAFLARCCCLRPAARSGSVGLRWAWSTAERRAGCWDWKSCRAV